VVKKSNDNRIDVGSKTTCINGRLKQKIIWGIQWLEKRSDSHLKKVLTESAAKHLHTLLVLTLIMVLCKNHFCRRDLLIQYFLN